MIVWDGFTLNKVGEGRCVAFVRVLECVEVPPAINKNKLRGYFKFFLRKNDYKTCSLRCIKKPLY